MGVSPPSILLLLLSASVYSVSLVPLPSLADFSVSGLGVHSPEVLEGIPGEGEEDMFEPSSTVATVRACVRACGESRNWASPEGPSHCHWVLHLQIQSLVGETEM